MPLKVNWNAHIYDILSHRMLCLTVLNKKNKKLLHGMDFIFQDLLVLMKFWWFFLLYFCPEAANAGNAGEVL